MFHKTSLRLTAFYLAIILGISLWFSANLFQLSVREFERGIQRQDELIGRYAPDDILPLNLRRSFEQTRRQTILEARARIINQLAAANLVILILGGGLSYFLARKTLEPIEASHAALERFTSDASHELRTPIAAMKSEIEAALLQPKLSAKESRALLQSNLEELDQLTALTNNLLSLARQEQTPTLITQQPLLPIIENTVKKVSEQAKEKSITVEQTVNPNNLTVSANYAQLSECLLVLIDNAIKYSPPKSSILLTARSKGKQTIISMVDHGQGISKQDLPHIFDRFYRGDQARSKQTVAGHGLGLAIAKQLVEQQNGSLSVVSQVGKSTTATITLAS